MDKKLINAFSAGISIFIVTILTSILFYANKHSLLQIIILALVTTMISYIAEIKDNKSRFLTPFIFLVFINSFGPQNMVFVAKDQINKKYNTTVHIDKKRTKKADKKYIFKEDNSNTYYEYDPFVIGEINIINQ